MGYRHGSDVTARDSHPLAGAFLLENLRLNGLLPMKCRRGQWGAVPVPVPGLALTFALALALALGTALVGLVPNGAVLVLPALLIERAVQGQFDLIIGSDLLDERDADATLAAFITRHAAPAAEVWLVDSDRGNRPAFNRGMADRGFSHLDERLVAAPLGGAGTAPGDKGRMLVYRRRVKAGRAAQPAAGSTPRPSC